MKEEFLQRMKQYLQDEFAVYEKTLQQDAYRGLRINTTKISVEDFQLLSICSLRPSRIAPQSFYIDGDSKHVGNHPAHMAGLFYMQEPSAASAVEILDVQENDWVLDLCAAPGGKSTQIAAKLQHTGFLVANEIEPSRAMVLLHNMERLGFSECMITNASVQTICHEMKGCFDRVLVDAPCSGEGMFKKHTKALADWSVAHVKACAKRQSHILDSAYQALKTNGVLVYSTCTYAMEENEEVIDHFLQSHPDMELMDTKASFGRCGFPYADVAVEKLTRILPMDGGEGHFVAKLCKRSETLSTRLKTEKTRKLDCCVEAFLNQQLCTSFPYVLQWNNRIYGKQTPFIKLQDVRVLRQGTRIGELKKNRMEPHQHLYTSSLYTSSFLHVYDMNDEECHAYQRGSPLPVAGYKGYVLLTWKTYPIAFAKGDGNVLKNKYPKGLRCR